ncbi:hypothetical protein EC957_011854 [Mortierella hygrophila]|uniref:Uncharacterized protein n=1 Tax=Mortierella hygrophila TaxID=979708 RepID=A0A9P6EU96_9FUNG|nr:hypothetical protein EC957_011854 [Mortierella hygrophila]
MILIEINRERFRDFSDPKNWYGIKVLSSGDEQHQLHALNLSTQTDSTKDVMRSCSVYSLRSPTPDVILEFAEAYALSYPIEELRHLKQ